MTSGHYTLKVYTSEKTPTAERSWQHTKIALKLLNPDFEPIVLTPKDEGDVRVIAEVATVLSSSPDIAKN
jgi:SOS-response transcriptional repressor LexA